MDEMAKTQNSRADSSGGDARPGQPIRQEHAKPYRRALITDDEGNLYVEEFHRYPGGLTTKTIRRA